MANEAEKVELTIKELDDKSKLLQSINNGANDKLNYAIKKLTKNIEKAVSTHQMKYNDDLDDKRLQYASTYPDTHPDIEKRGTLITKPDNNYAFTPENTKQFNKDTAEITKAFLAQKVKVEPFFASVGEGWERVKDLDMFTVDELHGLLFKKVKDGVVLSDEEPEVKK